MNLYLCSTFKKTKDQTFIYLKATFSNFLKIKKNHKKISTDYKIIIIIYALKKIQQIIKIKIIIYALKKIQQIIKIKIIIYVKVPL